MTSTQMLDALNRLPQEETTVGLCGSNNSRPHTI
jgi:hypothetical protein